MTDDPILDQDEATARAMSTLLLARALKDAQDRLVAAKALKQRPSTSLSDAERHELELVARGEDGMYASVANVLLDSLSEQQQAALAIVLIASDSALLERLFEAKFGKLERYQLWNVPN